LNRTRPTGAPDESLQIEPTARVEFDPLAFKHLALHRIETGIPGQADLAAGVHHALPGHIVLVSEGV
jgi:hypothetical protein